MSRVRRPFGHLGALLREAVVSARAQPVASIVSIVMVAGMCATVVLTTGRTVGAEQSVLGSIDDAGTRSIVVRAEADSGLDSRVIGRLAGITGIEWAAAFGPALDTRNAGLPDASPVPLRLGWGDDLGRLGAGIAGESRSAWASTAALDQLGMPDASGAVLDGDGVDYAIAGRLAVPDYLGELEPLVVAPRPETDVGRVAVLVVVAARPDLVAPVSDAVAALLGVDDPTKVQIATSEKLAQLRALVQGQLGSFGRGLVIVVFAVTAVLVAAILYGFVMIRRRDFGRRRALGATRGLIVGLLLVQTAMLAAIGAVLGAAGASIVLMASGDPLPGWSFTVAVGVLAVSVAVVAAVVPAVAASRREPIRELRVP